MSVTPTGDLLAESCRWESRQCPSPPLAACLPSLVGGGLANVLAESCRSESR